MEKIVTDDFIIKEALRIVEVAEQLGVTMRIMGAAAIAVHSPEFMPLYRKLNRLGQNGRLFTDIDLMAYSKQRAMVRRLFEKDFGYKVDKYMLLFRGNSRLLYFNSTGSYQIDVFFDKLEFSHDIFFGYDPTTGRLQLSFPTIPLADIILEKTQIHEINEKDVKDLIVLLRAHDIGNKDEREIVNAKYIAKVLADDWGFWYDVKINLGKVKTFSQKYLESNLLTEEDLTDIIAKIEKINAYIDEEPKTKKWEKRAKIGIRKCWWRSVEEVSR
uniref:Nucleotidyl transferase AbiEii/AbiGii toxin family protein n=1 Tax=Fervidicoccus fontis TaxID=683846 RepID=A0A7J3SPE8_9CREN